MIMSTFRQAAWQRRRRGRRARSMGWTHTGPARIRRRTARLASRGFGWSTIAPAPVASGPSGWMVFWIAAFVVIMAMQAVSL